VNYQVIQIEARAREQADVHATDIDLPLKSTTDSVRDPIF
jgi:hypothetical protein